MNHNRVYHQRKVYTVTMTIITLIIDLHLVIYTVSFSTNKSIHSSGIEYPQQ